MPVCAKIREGGGKIQPPVKLKECIRETEIERTRKMDRVFLTSLNITILACFNLDSRHSWMALQESNFQTHLGGSVGFAVGVIKMISSKGCAMFENEVLTPLSLFCGHYFGSNNKDANRDLIKCPIDELCTNKAVATVNLSTALLSREQTGLLLFLLLLTFIISSNA